VAHILSSRLGYQIFDREIIEAISRSTKVQEQIIELLDEGKRSMVASMTEQLFSQRVIDDKSYAHTLARVVRSISLIDPVIFIGRGACHILRGTGAFNVRITAVFEDRVTRVVEKDAVTRETAADRVKEQDLMRRKFIKSHFNRDIDDPTAYDLVANTSRIPPLVTANLIRSLYAHGAHAHGACARNTAAGNAATGDASRGDETLSASAT
jgi:cytidylate kinase